MTAFIRYENLIQVHWFLGFGRIIVMRVAKEVCLIWYSISLREFLYLCSSLFLTGGFRRKISEHPCSKKIIIFNGICWQAIFAWYWLQSNLIWFKRLLLSANQSSLCRSCRACCSASTARISSSTSSTSADFSGSANIPVNCVSGCNSPSS